MSGKDPKKRLRGKRKGTKEECAEMAEKGMEMAEKGMEIKDETRILHEFKERFDEDFRRQMKQQMRRIKRNGWASSGAVLVDIGEVSDHSKLISLKSVEKTLDKTFKDAQS